MQAEKNVETEVYLGVSQTLENSSSRASLFSSVSNMSFNRLDMKNKCYVALMVNAMLFFLGIALGAVFGRGYFC